MFYRDTWAEINLDAIEHNLNVIKKCTSKAIIAVLKANAYGHGDYWVAKKVMSCGAEMVAVSQLDEAVALRKQGFFDPILILGHVRERNVLLAQSHHITLTAISKEWVEEVVKQNTDLNGTVFHIKVDTGMNRLGMKTLDEVNKAIDLILNHNGVVEGIYTHYACADESNLDYCDFQYQRFESIVKGCSHYFKWIHCENSAAMLQYEDKLSNAARVGLAMFGVSPLEKDFELEPAFSLYSKLTCVKQVKKNEKVGYGATYTATQDCWIGTLPIGYADGFLRSNQGRHLIVNRQEVEIVGRICMDQCMVKLNQAEPVGSVVEVISWQMPLTRMAKELNTISYEILCILSDRIPRVIYEHHNKIAEINNRLHES